MNHTFKALLPWNTANFMPLNAFHPIYNFIIAKDRKSFSPPVEFQTFNERLFLEFLLFTEKGGVLQNHLKNISGKLQIEKQRNEEYKDIWNFFDINETLVGELSNSDLQILHTTPLSVGIKPFIYHLESFETLFYPWTIYDPFLLTSTPQKIQAILSYLRNILESPKCLRIVSHLPSTLEKFDRVFQSDNIKKKLVYCPLGFPISKRVPKENHIFRFIYTSSLHKNLNNMERRGMRIILQFIKIWLERYPEDEFILFIPPLEDRDFPGFEVQRIISHPQVYNFGNQYVTNSEFQSLLESADFMLIPSYQLHSASILKSMGAGVIPIVSDLVSVKELGITSKNSIILNIFSNLNRIESPIFGEIPSLEEFKSSYVDIADEIIQKLEDLKKNPVKKMELSHNAKALIAQRFDMQSIGEFFSNIIRECMQESPGRSSDSNTSHKHLIELTHPNFLKSLGGSSDSLVPLRPVFREDFDAIPLYKSFLDIGLIKVYSNGRFFMINDYDHSKFRGCPSLLSNNNERESFMGDWETNLMEGIDQIGGNLQIKSFKLKLRRYFNKFPKMKNALKKLGVNKIARQIGF